MKFQILQCGASTPTGTSATMSIAMLEAQVSRLMYHYVYIDHNAEPVTVGKAEYLNDYLEGTPRLLALAMPAIEEACKPLLESKEPNKHIALIIGIPSKRPGVPENIKNDFEVAIKKWSKKIPHHFSIHFLAHGHATGAFGLQKAIQKIKNEEVEFCIVGGVDSFLDYDSLKWLEDENRLLCTSNEFGFIPGEAASFFLVTSNDIAQKYSFLPKATILEVACDMEKEISFENPVCTGKTLANVIQKTAKDHITANTKIAQVYCDLNGERSRTYEWGFASQKVSKYFHDNFETHFPIHSWGDTGVASNPLLITLICESESNDLFHLVWNASDTKERGAVLLSKI